MVSIWFGLQVLLVIGIIVFCMQTALRRFSWSMAMAWVNGTSVFGFYLLLVFLLKDEPEVLIRTIPMVAVLVSVVLTLLLSEHFWQRLSNIQLQLAQAEKMASLGQLVAGVAHDLNTPLGALKSNIDVITRGYKKIQPQMSGHVLLPETIRFMEMLDKLNGTNQIACDRMHGIVDSLRDFARLDQAEFQEADLHAGIETTLALIEYQTKNRIEVVRYFGNIPKMRCYPNRLNQVFMNLLVNAVQAIRGEGVISIRTEKNDDLICIQIADTGMGITSQNLKRIFDPGFTTKGVGVGTGLGLAICYQIVQEHRGDLTVESEVGKGTIFTLMLPIIPENAGR